METHEITTITIENGRRNLDKTSPVTPVANEEGKVPRTGLP